MKSFRLFFAMLTTLCLACADDEAGEPDTGLTLYSLAAAGVFNNFCGSPVLYQPGTYSLQIEEGEFFWFAFPAEFNHRYQIYLSEASGQNVAVEEMECVSGQTSALTNSTATGQLESFELRGVTTVYRFIYCTEGCNNAFQLTIPSTSL